MNNCNFEGCANQVFVRKEGLCSGHYQQKYHGKPLVPLRPKRSEPKPTCPVKNCERIASSRGLCTPHASVCWRMSIAPESYPELSYGNCSICGRESNLAADHDHNCCDGNYSCGRCLRGMLCSGCNITLMIVEKGHSAAASDTVLSYIHTPPGVPTNPYVPAKRVDNHKGRRNLRRYQ